ncbi:hypothetical protein N7475_003496, partial [Penicillium sp. IBT 31633x]
ILNIYEGGSLFTGQGPEFERNQSRAHLAEMIKLLGLSPPSLLTGKFRDKFFSRSIGDSFTPDLLLGGISLEGRENTLWGNVERETLLPFMRGLLQWEPGKCSSAKKLAKMNGCRAIYKYSSIDEIIHVVEMTFRLRSTYMGLCGWKVQAQRSRQDDN